MAVDSDPAVLRRRRWLRWGSLVGVVLLAGLAFAGARWWWSRGDAQVTSVIAWQDSTSTWVLSAVWSEPADTNDCVAQMWKVETSSRGYEVFTSDAAPLTASFDAMCRIGSASAVLAYPGSDPTGTTVVVNGDSFVVVTTRPPSY